jgi:nucleoporin p58/p45
VTNVRGTTRFNDLQDELQKQIAQVDDAIQSFIQQKNDLDAFMPAHGDKLSSVPSDVKFVTRKYEGVSNALQSDAQSIEVVRNYVKQDADHARLSFRAIDNLKLPSQYHTSGLWPQRPQNGNTANNETDGQDLVGFFSQAADETEEQLKRYKNNISEVESHMHGVQASLVEQLQKAMASKNGGPTGTDEKLAELGAVLRDFEMGILKVASEVGSLKEDMTRLQLGEFINNSEPRDGVY